MLNRVKERILFLFQNFYFLLFILGGLGLLKIYSHKDFFIQFLPSFNIGRLAKASEEKDKEKGEKKISIKKGKENKKEEEVKRIKNIDFDPLSISAPQQAILLSDLAARNKKIIQREKEIEEKSSLLEFLQKQIKKDLESLQKIKVEIKSTLKTVDEEHKKKLTHLIKAYENMKPKQAAQILNYTPVTTLKIIFSLMNQRKLSIILGYMKPQTVEKVVHLIIDKDNPFIPKEKA